MDGVSHSETTQATAPSTGSSPDAGSALADTQAGDGSQASLTGQSEAQAVPQTGQSDPFEKRYKDATAWATKVHQTNLELHKQMQELQQQFSAMREQQQQVVDPELQPWDEGHKDHAAFLRLVDKAEYYDELIQGEENPDIVKALQAKQLRVLGEQGIGMLRAWRDDVRRQERERRLNPKAFYAKLIRQEAQPVVRETLQTTSANYQQIVAARDEAQKWVRDNPQVASKDNIQQVLKLMESGMPFNVASMAVEREHYRRIASNASKAQASAEEKERLLQGNAAGAVSRNPNAGKKVDVQQLRKDKGIRNGREFIDELFDLDKQGLL